MQKYNPDALYSFKCPRPIARELRLQYVPKNPRRKAEYFWCELTDVKDLIVIPDRVLIKTTDNSPHGYLGIPKAGTFFADDGREVFLTNIHQIYNGAGYAIITFTRLQEEPSILTHDFWTWAYNPFRMGGSCHYAIIAELPCSEEVDLGRGYKGFVATNPKTNKTYVCESETGAIVGNTMAAVTEDIAVADEEVMRKQIKDAAVTVQTAQRVSEQEFWSMLH